MGLSNCRHKLAEATVMLIPKGHLYIAVENSDDVHPMVALLGNKLLHNR